MNKEFVSRTHMDIQNNIEKLKQLISRSKEELGAFSRNGYGFAIVSSEKYDASDQVSSLGFHYSFYVAGRHPDKGPGLAQKISNITYQAR